MQRSLVLNSQGLLQDTLLSIDNLVLNGEFGVAQRGTSFPAITSGAYSLDRWQYVSSIVNGHDISQDVDVPPVSQTGLYTGRSILVRVRTAQSSLAAGAFNEIRQSIEGHLFQSIARAPSTLSFWVKASKTGIYSVGIRNAGLDRSFVAEYVINAANTWERKTITIPVFPVDGAWNYETGVGFYLGWNLGTGSNFRTVPNNWATGNFLGSTNSINVCDVVGNDFRLALVKLEAGIIATPFRKIPLDLELAACQRYFTRCFLSGSGHVASIPTNIISPLYLPRTMRAVPSASIVAVGARSNVSTQTACSVIMSNSRDGAFIIPAAATGFCFLYGESWAFNAEL